MNDMNLIQARHNMVEQQIRPWDVLDQRVLDLLEQMPRDEFVPENYRNLAYADIEIPLGQGETMLFPKMEGKILQALDVQDHEKVLEIGTGSGYLTALLARLALHVYSVELLPELKMEAERRLASHDIQNVTLEVGDAANGWDKHAPYDVIVVTGSLPVLNKTLQESLSVGGRMFVITGDAPIMEARLITRTGKHEFSDQVLFETDLKPLNNAPQPDRFVL